MTEQERLAALEALLNPKLPDPFISYDTGRMMRDIPPRRTVRERVQALLRRRRRQD